MGRPTRLAALAAVCAIVSAGACGDDAAPRPGTTAATTSTSETGTSSTEPTMTTTPTGTPPGDDGSIPPGSMAELAVADLVERLGVEPTDVTVVGSESVTWSDGSLGCPEPGMSYTQALVPGHRVVLTVDGATYEYHSGRDAAPFWCPPDRIRPPVDGAAAGT